MSLTSSRHSRRLIFSAALAVIAALGSAGCASFPDSVARFDRTPGKVEISSTPFFPQERYQCGPAALTTVLMHSGVGTTLESVTRLTYIPERHGSLQTELLATARAFERIPYRIEPTMAALVAELRAGRPVLVLQNLGPGWFPQWHYAVVVGVDADNSRVILRSGTDRRRETALRTFLNTWKRGSYWAVVTLVPGELPAEPDKSRYFSAVADLAAVGHYDSAKAAWSAALQKWPGDPVAEFGKANAAFQLDDFAEAERGYRALLSRHPDMHTARNNLAYALAGQGRMAEALEELRLLVATTESDDPLRDEYQESLREIELRAGVAD